MSGQPPEQGDSGYGYDGFSYGRERSENEPTIELSDLDDRTPPPAPLPPTDYDTAADNTANDDAYGYDDEYGYDEAASDTATYDTDGYDTDGYDTAAYDGEYGYDQVDYDEAGYDDVDEVASGDEVDPSVVSRRRFLAGLALSGAVGYTTFWALGRPDEVALVDPTTTLPPSTTPPVPTTVASTTTEAVATDPSLLVAAPVDQRILVLIELEGGNDGPSTVVPYTTGAYYDLRPNMAIPADQVIPIDDTIGFNPNLARLHQRQFAVVDGVGPVEGSLSHFEMVARWEQGDLYGNNGLRTGFLGRLADALDDGSPTIGLSVNGFTPRFNNVTASTLSLDNLNSLRVLTKDDWIFPAYREAVTGFSGGPMTSTMVDSWRHLVEIGNALPNDMEGPDNEMPMVQEGGTLGRQLAAAAEMIRADFGIRVVHARLGGFDTHKGHVYKQENLLKQVDLAVDGFLQLMEDYGLAERVLVATSSEFGRRAGENGNGLDHGAASTMLLFGPVQPGRYGAPLSFTDLDNRGNFKTSVSFDSYLGTLAENWLGVEAGSILPTSPELLTVI